jgi:hypothetical protein
MGGEQSRLNLRGATTLLVDSDAFTRGLIAQMLRGFGMDTPTTYENCPTWNARS